MNRIITENVVSLAEELTLYIWIANIILLAILASLNLLYNYLKITWFDIFARLSC